MDPSFSLTRSSGMVLPPEFNVDAALLSSDFTKLGPEVMLSGVALSLAEHLLEQSQESKK